MRDANSGLWGLTQIDYIFFGWKKIKRPADNRVPRNINANSIAVNGRLDAAVVLNTFRDGAYSSSNGRCVI